MQLLKLLYKSTFGSEPTFINQLTKAGSNRTYCRMGSEVDTVIGCIGTSAEENATFIYMARHFESHGLPVPHIISVSDDGMAYLQEDLGDTSLFDLIAEGRKAGHYGEAEVELLKRTLRQLPHLQFRGAEGFDFTRCYQCTEMDATCVMFDLNYFKYCFLKLADVQFGEYELEKDFRRLTESITSQSSDTFLYRDFQARNVMIRNGEPYMIDFQGGRRGPIYYDVASFLWQASSRFSDELRMCLIDEYLSELRTYCELPHDEFLRNLKVFVFFRTLQVLGAYGFRGLWEKKRHFIDSIPHAIANLTQLVEEGVADNYPELRRIALRLAASKYAQTTDKELTTQCDKELAKSLLQNDTTYVAAKKKPLVVRVFSFSYKKGIPADESGNGGGYVFDCRATHNPGRYEPYKKLTGLDKPVIDFLETDGEILRQLDSMYRLVDFHVARYVERGFTNLMISCGCTGGQHRSVYSAQHIGEYIAEKYGVEVHINHREQGITQVIDSKQKL